MTEEKIILIWAVLIISTISCSAISYSIGKYSGVKEIRNELVEKGWGYYSFNQADGGIEFNIKETK